MARQRRGFSLIEVTISLAILTVSLVGISAGAAGILKMVNHHRRATQAIACLEGVTEDLLVRITGHSDLATGGNHYLYFKKDGTPTTSGSQYYTVQWTVTADTPIVGVTDLDLRISWTDQRGPTSIRWKTYRS